MADIIQSALAVISLPGHTPRTAARALVDGINGDLGTAYDTARLGQWRRGERPIPQPVYDWLLRCSLSWAIRHCRGDIPDDQVDRLAVMLSPPSN